MLIRWLTARSLTTIKDRRKYTKKGRLKFFTVFWLNHDSRHNDTYKCLKSAKTKIHNHRKHLHQKIFNFPKWKYSIRAFLFSHRIWYMGNSQRPYQHKFIYANFISSARPLTTDFCIHSSSFYPFLSPYVLFVFTRFSRSLPISLRLFTPYLSFYLPDSPCSFWYLM